MPHSAVFEELFESLGRGAHFTELHRFASACCADLSIDTHSPLLQSKYVSIFGIPTLSTNEIATCV
jgi:hypothetical protein